MITLRYHVITIVSVFLALAVGLLVGGAFVDPVLEERLRSQTEDLRRDNGQLRQDIDALRAQVDGLDAFAIAALPALAENRLLGTTAVIVAQDGVEGAVLEQAQQALEVGGTEVVAVISALPTLVSEEAETQTLLADIVGAPFADPGELPAETATALAARLAEPTDEAGLPEDDVLNRLLSAGFLDSNASEATLARIGLPGQMVVVLGGGQAETPVLETEAFAAPLIRELAELEIPVAAGESATTPVAFVETVRGTDGVVTVDDLDLSMGGAALVLGLDRLLATGVGGAYGFKDGAQPLPPLP